MKENHSNFFFCCCDKSSDQDRLRGEVFGLHIQVTVHHREKLGQELKQEYNAERMQTGERYTDYWIALSGSCLVTIFYWFHTYMMYFYQIYHEISIAILYTWSATLNDLGPLKQLTNNKDHPTQTCTQAFLVYVIPKLILFTQIIIRYAK